MSFSFGMASDISDGDTIELEEGVEAVALDYSTGAISTVEINGYSIQVDAWQWGIYITLSTIGNYKFTFNEGTIINVKVNIILRRGEQGDKGIPHPDGTSGSQGSPGWSGISGDYGYGRNGLNGIDGKDGICIPPA